MKQMKRPAAQLLVGFGLSLLATASANAQSVLFWSTQATPVNEQKDVREIVLKSSPVPVEFVTNNDGPYFTRLNAELQAGKGSIGLLGALHGFGLVQRRPAWAVFSGGRSRPALDGALMPDAGTP